MDVSLINTQLTGVEIGLSKNSGTEGFDFQAGKTWVYPTNYPPRDYQYNIIQEALLKNTLVSLPTGLGKTFIAAVVMYNFYRWYPMGKIIFMAPTKPLVKQQIDACYSVMAIPKNVTAELTGTKIQTSRSEIWREKRVFFVTPQVLQNDLDSFPDFATKIKCLVFDEAHKAKGNHAYCEVIRKLVVKHKHFRVLALSATPGSSINDAIEVIRNLLISHMELRTDESPDVAIYIFQRTLDIVVVPLGGKLKQIRDNYIQILETYTRVLIQHRVIHGNCSNLTKGKIFMTMKEFQEKNKHNRGSSYGDIMRNLNICVTLYHGYELLIRHGLRAFLNFFEEHSEKPLLRGNRTLIDIMTDVDAYLGPKPNVEVLPDGSITEISKHIKFGHPKFYKLRDILLSHFEQVQDESTRVIVFCEYRESVMEAYALLIQHRPILKPRIFLGQGAITQKQQMTVVKAFRQGECNTLISTCIGEEGLDVGNVDLIICFDISNKSPVRMIQRMGRTGRKRQGRVVVLVTEGREQKTLEECLIQKHYLSSNILQSRELNKEMYKNNPRMIPENITPTCQKIYITVQKTLNQKSASLKDMFNNMAISSESSTSISQEMKNVEIIEAVNKIPSSVSYWNKEKPLDIPVDKTVIDFSKKIEKLRSLQAFEKIGHSTNSEILVSLMQYADSKRYNIPVTQMPIFAGLTTQSNNLKRTKFEKSDSMGNFKQSDIRTMFMKSKSFDAGSTASQAIPEEKMEIIKSQGISTQTNETTSNSLVTELHREITNYISICFSERISCKICENFFSCSRFKDVNGTVKIREWIQPDFSIIDNLNAENINLFSQSLNPNHITEMEVDFGDSVYFEDLPDLTEIKKDNQKERKNQYDDTFSTSFAFQAPKNMKNLFQKCGVSVTSNSLGATTLPQMNEKEHFINDLLADGVLDNVEFTQFENDLILRKCEAVSSTVTAETVHLEQKYLPSQCHEILLFYKLNSIEDLFTPVSSYHLEHESCLKSDDSDATIIVSPEVTKTPRNTNKLVNKSDGSGSPILSTFDRVRLFKNKANKRLFDTRSIDNNSSYIESVSNFKYDKTHLSSSGESLIEANKNERQARPNLSNLKKDQSSCFYVPRAKQSKMSPKQVDSSNTSSDLNKSPALSPSAQNNTLQMNIRNKKQYIEELASNVSVFCDLSIFGLDVNRKRNTECAWENSVLSHESNSVVKTDSKIKKPTTQKKEPSTNNLSKITPEDMQSKNVSSTGSEDLFESFCDLETCEFPSPNKNSIKVKEGCENKKNACAETAAVTDLNLTENTNKSGEVTHAGLCFEIGDICDLSIFGITTRKHINNNKTDDPKNIENTGDIKNIGNKFDMDITSMCDLSAFGIKSQKNFSTDSENTGDAKNIENKVEVDITSMCDLSALGIKAQKNVSTDSANTGDTKNIEKKVEMDITSMCDLSAFGIKSQKNVSTHSENTGDTRNIEKTVEMDITNMCDLSVVGIKFQKNDSDSSKERINYPRNKLQTETTVDSTSKESLNRMKKIETERVKVNIEAHLTPEHIKKSKLRISDSSNVENDKQPIPKLDNTFLNISVNDSFHMIRIPSKIKQCGERKMNKDEVTKNINSIVDKYMALQNNIIKKDNINCIDITGSDSDFDSPVKNSNLKSTQDKTQLSITQMVSLIDCNNSVTKADTNKNVSQENKESDLHLLPSNTLLEEECSFSKTNFKLHKKRTPLSTRKPTLVCKTPDDALVKVTPKKAQPQERAVRQQLKFDTGALNVDNSDDEFDIPTKGIAVRPKRNLKSGTEAGPSKDEMKPDGVKCDERRPAKIKKVKKKIADCPFIENEALLTSDEFTSDFEVEGGSSQDVLEASFVDDDDDMEAANSTDMHAQYLQSVRSPLLRRGTFKIPLQPARHMDVYSQIDDCQDDTYVNDSFCINSQDVDLTQNMEMSELEIAEMVLKEKRKKRKKNKQLVPQKECKSKRRRVICISSDSD